VSYGSASVRELLHAERNFPKAFRLWRMVLRAEPIGTMSDHQLLNFRQRHDSAIREVAPRSPLRADLRPSDPVISSHRDLVIGEIDRRICAGSWSLDES
jgi:hypothetical protein